MSVVVAIKDKDVIFMGADSQVSSAKSKFSFLNPNNYKIWKYKKFPEYCMFGGVGALRDINLIKVNQELINELDVIKGTIDFDYVVEKLVSNLFEFLGSHNRIVKDSDEQQRMTSAYLFSYKDSLFEIGSDGSVLEITDYTAIGSGQDIAIGSLNTTENADPIERIVLSVQASCKTNLYVNYPIIVFRSDMDEVTVINSAEDKNYKK